MSTRMSMLTIAAGLLGLVGSAQARPTHPMNYSSGSWYAVKPGAGPNAHSSAALEKVEGIKTDGRRGKIMTGGMQKGSVDVSIAHPYKDTKGRTFNGADGKSWTHELRSVPVKNPTLGIMKTERILRTLAPNRFKANPDVVKAVKSGKKIYKVKNSATGV